MAALAQPLPGAGQAALEAELRALQSSRTHPLASLAALAVRDGVVAYEGYFGQRSVQPDLLANADTLYRIASVSKLVTAIGVMKLVEAGRIDLDADVGKYLGAPLRNPGFADQVVTTRMLLSHTSSLRDVGDLPLYRVGQNLAQALVASVGATAQSTPWALTAAQAPAQRFFSYANINYVVLATLVESVSRQRFDRYMQQAVLGPLGLRGGFYPAADLSPADVLNLATLYRKSPDGGTTWAGQGPWVAQGPDRSGAKPLAIEGLDHYVVGTNAGVFGPQGGLRISVRGLGVLMRMFINQGTVDGVTLLQPATVQQMLRPAWVYNGQAQAPNGDTYHGLFLAWGLGVQIFTDQGGTPGAGDRAGAPMGGLKGAGHLGEAYGLLSGLIFDPALRHGVAYAMGGLSANPDGFVGEYSAFSRWEESVLRSLHQEVILAPRR